MQRYYNILVKESLVLKYYSIKHYLTIEKNYTFIYVYMKKENRNWIAWIALVVSGIAIIVSVIAICIACPHIPELGFDYQGVVVGVLSLLVTTLIGWNIFSIIDIKK